MNSLHDTYANQLFNLYSDTKSTRVSLVKEQSKYDRILSSFYHEIESKDISPSNAYDYLVAPQNILSKRRAIKQELHHIGIIERSLHDNVEALKPKRNAAVKRTTDYNRTLNVHVTINDVLYK